MMSTGYVYIAGYSRCGSTTLDILLGSHSDIVGVGELSYFFDDLANPQRKCTCGAAYEACDFWKDAFDATKASLIASRIRKIELRSNYRRLQADQLDPDDIAFYRKTHTRLFRHIREHSGKPIILDSSKSARDAAGRCLAIAKHTDERVRVIHLVRSPKATVDSFCRNGSNWRREGHGNQHRLLAWRAMIGWRLANQHARDLRRQLGNEAYLPLRHEDVVRDPAAALQRIGEHIGVDLGEVSRKIAQQTCFYAGHNVGGNRLRHAPVQLASGPSPEPRLGALHRLGIALLDGQLARELDV